MENVGGAFLAFVFRFFFWIGCCGVGSIYYSRTFYLAGPRVIISKIYFFTTCIGDGNLRVRLQVWNQQRVNSED
jgi:hypothetical protein